ncbi:probable G-protein coupled receptor 101 [Periophthalmus magnuspinnatus]|uniref:probable G-protein coupled receptor 101 n=1 Tax=Periophthalmus magnuspinnatus TaxID=409849 RepID=UPI00145BA269|nr:probable G-protein coupled receptor 101 [Periophthalmus magnuspinnatus]
MGTNQTDVPWLHTFSSSSEGAVLWSSTINSMVKMVCIMLIVCVSLFGNVVVLLVFQRKPQLLHVANRFVLNLLLADLLQTILVMPFAIAATVPGVWPLHSRLCQALVVLQHLFAFAGVNTIIVVSVDRYLAIIHPLSYPTRMTPNLGTNLIICTWVLSFLQSTPPLYGWGTIDFDHRLHMCSVLWSASLSYAVLVFVLSFWLPMFIMLGCYWMVFRAARRQNALVHPIQTQSLSQPCPSDIPHLQSTAQSQPLSQLACSPDGAPTSRAYPVRVRHRRFYYHCKAARVVFVIMASYILSMGPYSIINTISMSSRAAVPQWMSSLALVLFFLQCCLHPYIYGYMHRSVRKEFLALLCGLFCKRGRPRQSSAMESCFTTEGRSAANPHLPSLAARVFPMRTWEECTTSSSPTFERKSRDSRKETTSTSISSEKEMTVPSKQSTD